MLAEDPSGFGLIYILVILAILLDKLAKTPV
jgi:hypothetical protein